MFSGMLGLLLGGVAFVLIEGGLIARMLGWMALGTFLGLGLGVASWQLRRAVYGLVGGALAGLVGGALYEIFTQAFLSQSDQAQIVLSAVGLVLIGISLGVIIPLSISVIGALTAQRGLVVYRSGPRSGTEVELIGAASLGSSDACDVYIQDKNVEKKQAQIDKGPKGFQIKNIGSTQTFWVDRQPVAPGQLTVLQHGAIIKMGQIEMRFQLYG
jgi:hypothetical protein